MLRGIKMSDGNQQITIRSKKQHIRLWFECFKICRSDNRYTQNLSRVDDFYADWGDVTATNFDIWWKNKQHLFQDKIVQEVKKISKSPDVLTLSIPLDENISSITKQVKDIVEKKQLEKLSAMGIDPNTVKSKTARMSKYSFTQKEIKGLFHYINLEIYKIYLELGRPPINRQFLMEVRKNLDARPKSLLKRTIVNLPRMSDFDRYKTNADFEDIVRSIRRSIKNVEKTLENVSNGKFP